MIFHDASRLRLSRYVHMIIPADDYPGDLAPLAGKSTRNGGPKRVARPYDQCNRLFICGYGTNCYLGDENKNSMAAGNSQILDIVQMVLPLARTRIDGTGFGHRLVLRIRLEHARKYLFRAAPHATV